MAVFVSLPFRGGRFDHAPNGRLEPLRAVIKTWRAEDDGRGRHDRSYRSKGGRREQVTPPWAAAVGWGRQSQTNSFEGRLVMLVEMSHGQ